VAITAVVSNDITDIVITDVVVTGMVITDVSITAVVSNDAVVTRTGSSTIPSLKARPSVAFSHLGKA
jgi:hypothetical protein